MHRSRYCATYLPPPHLPGFQEALSHTSEILGTTSEVGPKIAANQERRIQTTSGDFGGFNGGSGSMV